jgi:hypothetical protein
MGVHPRRCPVCSRCFALSHVIGKPLNKKAVNAEYASQCHYQEITEHQKFNAHFLPPLFFLCKIY